MWVTLGIQVVKIVLPIVMELISKHYNATGALPTEEEILNQLQENADKAIAVADAWLEAHPKET